MKTDVEELSPTRVKLTIEVPFEELEHAFDVTYKSLAKQVRIKGFRPGKAPARLIDRYVGRGAVISEAVNHAVPELYNEAIQKEEIFALGQPDVEVTKLEDNEELAFTAEVDIRPKFEVKDYKGIEVTVDNATVTEEQVDEQIGTLRERFSTLVGADRPVEDGDHLSIDLSASIDGEKLEDVAVSGYSYEVGTNTMLEGLDETLRGMEAGGEATFKTTLVGGEHGGKEADVTVTVQSVKVKELPELDDEFAKDNDFDTLADLKADIRAKSVEEKEKAAKNAFDDALVAQAVENMTVDMPEGMIEERMDGIVREYAQYMANQGIRIDDYLKMIGTDMKTFRESMRATAEKQARTEVLLAAVAEAENVQISEEDLQAEYEKLGEAYGMKAEDVAKAIDVAGLTADLRRERAMSIISESGVAVEKKAEEPAKTEEASKAKKKPAAKKAAKTEETEGEEAPKAKKTTRKSTKTEEKTEE